MQLQFIDMPANLWVWLITLSYITLLVSVIIHICACLQLYVSGRTPNSYHYNGVIDDATGIT